MSDRSAWQRAFGASHGPRAVAALYQAWHDLVSQAPDTFHPGRKEPDLTEHLCFFLEAQRSALRLPGRWMNEVPQGEVVIGGKKSYVRNRKRTDIRYFTERDDPATHLVFEFKKLSHQPAQRRKYVGTEGMLRFISGEYSIGDPVALMVGILTVHEDDCVPPLARWLNSDQAKADLLMERTDGRQTRKPSALFECAHFDTEHLRPKEKAPEHGTIVISHLFLGFPNLPRTQAKREQRAALQAAMDG